MKRKKRKLKASYTIEAALIMPLVFTTLLIAVKLGVSMHEQVKEKAIAYNHVIEINPVKEIRTIKNIHLVIGENDGN